MPMPFHANGLVVLLTDFGYADGYVAEMKGAMLSVARGITLVDGTHDIPPQDVATGAVVLERIQSAFPPGTVFVAVVDPGVGTQRRGLVVVGRDHVFVGPDNGLLVASAGGDAHYAMLTCESASLPRRSKTFNGRDLFGPVAAMIAGGRDPESLVAGPVTDPVRVAVEPSDSGPDFMEGPVRYVDRFGNIIIDPPSVGHLPDENAVVVVTDVDSGARYEAIWGVYGVAERDGLMVVHVDSSGGFEIALKNDSAALRLGMAVGKRVRIAWGSP